MCTLKNEHVPPNGNTRGYVYPQTEIWVGMLSWWELCTYHFHQSLRCMNTQSISTLCILMNSPILFETTSLGWFLVGSHRLSRGQRLEFDKIRCKFLKIIFIYSKTWPLKKKTKKWISNGLSLNAGHMYRRMLHWSILRYFRPSLSYHLSITPLLCIFLSGSLWEVLL